MIKNNKKGALKAKNSGLGSGGGSQHLSLKKGTQLKNTLLEKMKKSSQFTHYI